MASCDVREVLRSAFGFEDFRAGQRAAVDAVLAGGDAVVLLPTGGGKSLCYQVPAVVMARAGRGTTIVVSPLIALMDDQVGALAGRGIAAAAIHSHQEDDERRDVFGRFARGELALLYVSPERAALGSFQSLASRVRIAMLAIDEAHCVSQWGHDFRPEYQRLHELRAVVRAPTIALTATATPRVMTEIVRSLELHEPTIVRGEFRRPNLAFEVRHEGRDADRIATTIAVLEEAGLRTGTGSGGGRGIVYCATRKKTEWVADALKQAGFAVGHYHAGRTALARERSQRAFALARTRVLVATSAFGMGVDYPDVRAIVHFQAPGSVEAYYQEAGRAGRDGAPGRCVMLFGVGDLVTQRRLGDRGGAASQQRTETALAALERYARTAACRQAMICEHFDPTPPAAAPAPVAGAGAGGGTLDLFAAVARAPVPVPAVAPRHADCGTCDVCRDPDAVRAAQLEERPVAVALGEGARRVIVEALGVHARTVGKVTLARALRGSRAKAVAVNGLERLPQFGALAEASEDAIVETIEQLVRERVLERRGKKYPTVGLPASRAQRSERAARTATDAPHARGGRQRDRASRGTGIARELDTFRKRMARQLKWKAYMVLQQGTIAAIVRHRPASHAALNQIPGLGPAKIARFGDEILAVVRRHPPASQS